MNIFQTSLEQGSFKDQRGSTITKVGTNHMKQYGKGFSLDCIGSNYIYSDTVNGDFNTIVLEFWLSSEVTKTATANYLGSTGGTTGTFTLGIANGTYVDETFSWVKDSVIGGGYIKENISKGYNQIILRYNGSYYDCYLNGVQVTTYNDGSDKFSDSAVYLGKQETAANYFTGQVLNCSIDNESFTTGQVGQAYSKFQNRSPINPPIRNFEYSRSVFNGNGLTNYVDIIACDSAISSQEDGYIEFKASLNIGVTAISYVFVYNQSNIDTLFVRFQNGKLRIGGLISSSLHIVETTSTFNDGVHRNYKLMCSGSTYTLEVDDVSETLTPLVGTNNGKWFNDLTGNYIQIGRYQDNLTESFYHQGLIYDFNICDNVCEKLSIYNLDEGSGTAAYDISGNSNDSIYYGSNYHKAVVFHTTGAPYLDEQFNRLAADSKTIYAPQDWIAGTGTWKVGEDSDSKYIECVGGGTISIQTDATNTSKTLTIPFYNGSSWTTYTDTLTNMITTHAWITSFTNGVLLFTLASGDRIRNILITD